MTISTAQPPTDGRDDESRAEPSGGIVRLTVHLDLELLDDAAGLSAEALGLELADALTGLPVINTATAYAEISDVEVVPPGQEQGR